MSGLRSEPQDDHISALANRSRQFAEHLRERRLALAPPGLWYPYGTLSNFQLLDRLLTGANRNLLRDIEPKRAADIGAADGDLAFFLEQEGWEMTIIDNAPTNWNGLRGARLHKEAAGSSVQIVEMDLDSHFALNDQYDVVFFLGILYHLKNPFFVLEELARRSKYVFLSTRITRWSKPPGALESAENADRQLLERLPVAYLLGPTECNNDSTNYWIFSDAGLRRILDRSGWSIEDYLIVGNVEDADPFSAAGDARAFCLIKSRHTQ